MTLPKRRKCCCRSDGEPCISVGKRGPCSLCTDMTNIRSARKSNWQDPEFRARNAAAVKAAASRRLSWCIPELIDDYRLLARHLGVDEARRIIEAQILEHHTVADGDI